MRYPLDGVLFDLRWNGGNRAWRNAWGPRPADLDEASAIVGALVALAPRLIPIYSHRMLPDRPAASGNPVYSVHQMDLPHYGNDLADYLYNEFRVPRPVWAASEPKRIEFWDNVTEGD